MMEINKGVGQPVELMGVKGTYLPMVISIIVGSLFLAFILYWIRVNTYLITLVVLGLMFGGVWYCLHMSAKYGLHGIAKQEASRSQPNAILLSSAKPFAQLRRENQRQNTRKVSASTGGRK